MLINIIASSAVSMMIMINTKLVIVANVNYAIKKMCQYIIFVRISIKVEYIVNRRVTHKANRRVAIM